MILSYATPAHLKERFKDTELVDLTNANDPTATVVDDTVLQIALEDAAAEIDAILTRRYTTPLSNPPAVLIKISCDIARYNLYSGQSTEEVETRYKNASKLLKQIADGVIDLGINSGTTDSPAFNKPASIFSIGMMGRRT